MTPTATPPLPPDVTQQQNPLVDYAQGAMQNGMQPGGPQPSAQRLEQLVNQSVEGLAQIASLVDQEKPAALPIVKMIAQMFAKLVQEVKSSKQGQSQQPNSAGMGPGPQQGVSPEGPASLGM
jgi:hypothetical protein